MKKCKIRQLLKNKKGFSGYIEAVVAVFIICMVISMGVNIFPAFILKNDLDDYAEKALRRVELSGNTENETIGIIKDIAKEYNLEPEINIECEYINGTNKIQIDTKIVLTARQSYTFDFGLLGTHTITLYGKATGYSEVYFK